MSGTATASTVQNDNFRRPGHKSVLSWTQSIRVAWTRRPAKSPIATLVPLMTCSGHPSRWWPRFLLLTRMTKRYSCIVRKNKTHPKNSSVARLHKCPVRCRLYKLWNNKNFIRLTIYQYLFATIKYVKHSSTCVICTRPNLIISSFAYICEVRVLSEY
jgi:hypothetical protein